VAEILKERGHEVLLIVSEKEIDTVALKAHPDFRAEKLPSVGMPNVLSPAFVRFLRRSWEGYVYCRGTYRKFRPSVILGMGGFTSTAPILAGRRLKLPTLIHESKSEPATRKKIVDLLARASSGLFQACLPFFKASTASSPEPR
jgi:UDP-N-acetylglucosamine--N-acetylmuramyl-(pentapeptide) pyrophosphoryl-undecaprenol N-acetylglucosamine transferase